VNLPAPEPRDSPSGDGERSEGSEEADPSEVLQEHQLRVELEAEEFLLDSHPEIQDEEEPYGPLGAPLKRHSPFYIGFIGAVGALLAYWIGQQIVAVGSVLILVVVAMFLAAGLNPSVEFFMRRGIRRALAVVLVIVLVVAAIALFVVAIVPVISDQVAALTDQVPQWFTQLQSNRTFQSFDHKYHVLQHLQEMLKSGSLAKNVFGGVVGVGLAVLSGILNTFIVIVLTLYFLASLPTLKRALYQLAPATRRDRVTSLGDQILSNVGAYVSGAFVVALCAGISSLVFLFAVGMPQYAVALAFVVMILDVIPMIGATLGAVVVTLIGFATSPTIGLACIIFYIVYQQFENYVIYPRVMSRSVDIPGSLIVVAALIGAGLLGVVGALLAIPAAASALLLIREVFVRRQDAR
jgi:predicted PurR-regulated permease PerM